MQAAVPDTEFIELFAKFGAADTARHLGIGKRAVQARRRRLERIHRMSVPSPNDPAAPKVNAEARLLADLDNGTIIIGSDAHYWPDIVTTAHRAFVKFISEHQPAIVMLNGDVLDGSSISRHPPIGWENQPTLIQEVETCQERLGEIQSAIKTKRTRKIWSLGNHDARFETRLATVAPEYAKVHGVHLKDHFPTWEPCWSLWVNDDAVIKHRYKGGIHATYNNTLLSGRTIVTGHLHSLKVTPFSDYNGTRWGVDTGTLAEPTGPQFLDYTEDNPKSWVSGFVVLTFKDGRLLWPEVVPVMGDGEVCFRGKLVSV